MCSEALANTICTGEADARLRTSWQFTKPCLHTECFNQSMFNVQQHSNKGTGWLHRSALRAEKRWTTSLFFEFVRTCY